MLNDPQIRIEIEGMQPTLTRVILQIRKPWRFDLETCTQVLYLGLWQFLQGVHTRGGDAVMVLRKMKRNKLDESNRREFWTLITRWCREQYAESHFYTDADVARGFERRRRIPELHQLGDSIVATEGEDPFDVIAYLPEIVAGLDQEDQDVVNLLMYEEMTVGEFCASKNLDSRKWYRVRDAVKSRMAIEIAKIQRKMIESRQRAVMADNLVPDKLT